MNQGEVMIQAVNLSKRYEDGVLALDGLDLTVHAGEIYALLGGNDEASRKWMHAQNLHLDGVPAKLVRSVAGLVRVVDYLDAMRGKS